MMHYRLALDLGSTSLGWSLLRLRKTPEDIWEPYAIIKAGVRIFSDGRDPQSGSSLAVTRREKRAARRRRDRLLKRKARMMRLLIEHGFFPKDEKARKALENLDPYLLRSRGLDEALTPEEFARLLFHINQRRGFKSNRKTDKQEKDSSVMKGAISSLRDHLTAEGLRSVGEYLYRRAQNKEGVRARRRETMLVQESGKNKKSTRYDLYIDRAMIEEEFDALFAAQTKFNPSLFNETARAALKDCLLHQRRLRPVKPGRCSLLPEEERAALALPSTQRARIYQELNHLYLLDEKLMGHPLTLLQRDLLAEALENKTKLSFKAVSKLLEVPGTTRYNLEDEKRQELKGNVTSVLLCKHFGKSWFSFSEQMQDELVEKIRTEESEQALIDYLQKEIGVDEPTASALANTALPEGYGSLSRKALAQILPALKAEVVTYDKAVLAAGFESHSQLSHLEQTGEVLQALPYYGEYLGRHVGFGSGDPKDSSEKRFGRIANPTVHIGLNQVRKVVNALIARYGKPAEVVMEVARELKQSKAQREEIQKEQAINQKRNDRMRDEIAKELNISKERVHPADLTKLILWEELSHDVASRRCPYSGVQISLSMLFSEQVEIEHILPYARTLDDSLNNKTLAMRAVNRLKGNRTPWEAKDDFEKAGWDYEGILARASLMKKEKRARFAADAYEKWLKNDKDFLARALNDTRYLSRIAREYLSLICPNTWVVTGRMTSLLRGKLGLNDVLGLKGEKNRNDHRHHAVDACVIGITDRAMLQRFAHASASAKERALARLVEKVEAPWENYFVQVHRAIDAILVSHKPDHGYEDQMHDESARALLEGGTTRYHKEVEGKKTAIIKKLGEGMIPVFGNPDRHGRQPDGSPRPYKWYEGNSNDCIEIVCNEKGVWQGEVVSTFEAYQDVRKNGKDALRHPTRSLSGKPLVMRLMMDDMVHMETEKGKRVMRVVKISGNGQIFFADHNEANVDARNRNKDDAFAYTSKTASSLQKAKGQRITISPIGILNIQNIPKKS